MSDNRWQRAVAKFFTGIVDLRRLSKTLSKAERDQMPPVMELSTLGNLVGCQVVQFICHDLWGVTRLHRTKIVDMVSAVYVNNLVLRRTLQDANNRRMNLSGRFLSCSGVILVVNAH